MYLPTPEWVRETGTSRAKAQLGNSGRSLISPGLRYGHLERESCETRRDNEIQFKELLSMTRTSLAIFLAASMMATVGCASKNYVKQQTTPLINKTNELDDMTAKNTKDIKDVDARAQAGIQTFQAKAADVDQKAQAAGQTAASAHTMANPATKREALLPNTVVNLDDYRPVAE